LDLAAAIQTIYVSEVAQNPQVYAGVLQQLTDVCVLKVAAEVLLSVLQEHQCGAVSKLADSAELVHLMPTVELSVTTEQVQHHVVLMRLVAMLTQEAVLAVLLSLDVHQAVHVLHFST